MQADTKQTAIQTDIGHIHADTQIQDTATEVDIYRTHPHRDTDKGHIHTETQIQDTSTQTDTRHIHTKTQIQDTSTQIQETSTQRQDTSAKTDTGHIHADRQIQDTSTHRDTGHIHADEGRSYVSFDGTLHLGVHDAGLVLQHGAPRHLQSHVRRVHLEI